MPEFVHPKNSSPGACEFPSLATAPSGFKELPNHLTNAEQKLTAPRMAAFLEDHMI